MFYNSHSSGGDIAFDVKVMHGYRKFCNKIYQATKYVLSKIDDPSFRPHSHPTKIGQESLAELWILHKLNTAAAEVNAALTAREFSQATKIAYEYWLYQLCDVYIENSKTIIQDGTPLEQDSAKQTLYTALEGGLTLLHPFMPFLTEELWQRIPRRPKDECPSIMGAAYPEYLEELDDPASEEAYELILAVSKAIRSLAAEYAIKSSASVYVQLFTVRALFTCEAQLPSMRTLIGKPMQGGSIELLAGGDAKPAGCVTQAVNADAACHLLVKGHVDFDGELLKLTTRLTKAKISVSKQTKIIEGLENAGKWEGEVVNVESRKLGTATREVELLEASKNQFEELKSDNVA